MNTQTSFPTDGLVRLPQILSVIPVSPTTWWVGVRSGRFPASIKLGRRTTCWRAEDIRALIDKIAKGEMVIA